MYVYALIGFAGYRTLYDSQAGIYCETMYQCLVTTVHRGLIQTPLEVPSTKRLVGALQVLKAFRSPAGASFCSRLRL